MSDDATAGRTLNWRAFRVALAICTGVAVVVGVLSMIFLGRIGYGVGVFGGGLLISVLALFDQLGPRKLDRR